MSTTSSGYRLAEELPIQNHLCVLPCGELSENGTIDWSEKELIYYQYYFVNDQPADRMFRSFIFNPMRMRENYLIYPMYTGLGKLARVNDWILTIDHLFKEKVNFHALANNMNQGDKTDIWVTIPYPNSLQENFGKVLGVKLNFTKESDRIQAIQWWIDSFLMRWQVETKLHDKLTFKGFVWQRTSIDSGDEELVMAVNDYIHNHNLFSLWLFNYGSSGCLKWSDLKFDAACANPNYYGNTEVDYNWIINATVFAQYYHTGMQVNFGKGSIYNETHIYDYLNIGVKNGYMYNSLLAFQFPNQKLKDLYKNNLTAYIQIYAFIKKTYQRFSYIGIPYD
jgi:hypothetical protein